MAIVLGASSLAPSPAAAQGPASVANIAAGLQDSVVNISTIQTVADNDDQPVMQDPKGSPFEKFFNEFFDSADGHGATHKISSLGSGFVYDPSGLIVTNDHVIEGADEIMVSFSDGRKLKVTKVLGRDPKTDLALLKVDPKQPLKAVSFGNSSKMRVGDWVMAVGNPFGLGGTVTVGIVSATKRDINAGPYDDFIQTDAAINRGNSGGPLFNMEGQVIGVNTAIISPTGGSIGIGFAVPSNTALRVIRQLRKFGETRRGWIGVHVQNVTPNIAGSLGLTAPRGALIAEIRPKSPAANAGLQVGDVILNYDGQPIDAMRTLPRAIAETMVGKVVPVKVLRDGMDVDLTVAVAQVPQGGHHHGVALGKADNMAPEEETLMGVTMTVLTPQLRKHYGIEENVAGVLVTAVDPKSAAAHTDLKPGDVIIEVMNAKVMDPEEVLTRVAAVKRSGRKSAVFLVSHGKGKLSFVALPLNRA